jgi:hypothetical protein
LIDTSREPVDTIDKFNVSPINDNAECRRSTAPNDAYHFRDATKLVGRFATK